MNDQTELTSNLLLREDGYPNMPTCIKERLRNMHPKSCGEATSYIEALEYQLRDLAASVVDLSLANSALERQLAEVDKDAARLKWLHGTNEDANGYEYGVAKMRYVECKTEWLWCLSDHSDIDAAMKEQA